MASKVYCEECNAQCEYSYSCMCWYCPDCTERQAQAEKEVLEESTD